MILLAACTLFTTSCSDYLEKFPLDTPSNQTFLANTTELEMALAGCYTPLWLAIEEVPFSLVFDQCSDIGYDRNTSSLQEMGQGSADAKNGMALSCWTEFYKGISRCNYLLNNMSHGESVVPPATFARIKAEAQFLRALYYSYLVELFGDVPLVTESLTLENSQIPRRAKSEIVDFILKDFSEAASVLPVTNNPTSGRPSKGAALALKARIALFNERWQDAISASSEVIAMEGTQYNLDPDYANLFTYPGQTSKEIIFSIQYLKGQKTHTLYRLFGTRNASGHTNKKPAYQLQDAFECTDGLQIDKSPLYNPQKPYENRDPRLEYTLAVPGSEFLGYQFETHGDSIQCWTYLTTPPRRIDNQEVLNAYATFTGICWRKYTNVEDRTGVNDCDNNIIIIRYAEVLLTYAEAKIKAGQIDDSVLDAINKVRQRLSVKMPPITTRDASELFYAVARERKYEFSCEGLRLFDIRRWKIADEVMNTTLLGRMKRSFPSVAPRVDQWGTVHYEGTGIPIAEPGQSTDFAMRVVDIRKFNPSKHYLWPIPYIERQTNPNLTQNPNWE
ncbi:RagB/SusD family nutrient uptake outer membrane protein [termite gut metagenome]|uniref:RagB/SusD family nutrient uptake outer membrane protein n=1 Tax=termite gut metagenome TaxID=433724 RepID=A0A5J4RNA1_9ZZZZ